MLPPPKIGNATQSLAKGAEQQRNKQIDVYKKDRSNNKRQMDDIRHSQYRKQNTAVKSQKSRMQTNAAQASKAVTGSADYFKETFDLQDFIDLCEGNRRRVHRRRGKERGERRANRDRIDNALSAVRGKEDDDPRTMPAAPKKKTNNLAAFRAQQPEEKKREGIKEPQSQIKKGKRIPKVGTVHQRMSVKPKVVSQSKKPKGATAPQGEPGYGGGPTISKGEERAALVGGKKELQAKRLENEKNKEKRFADREKREKRERMWNRAKGVAQFGRDKAGELLRNRSKDPGDQDGPGASVNKATVVSD